MSYDYLGIVDSSHTTGVIPCDFQWQLVSVKMSGGGRFRAAEIYHITDVNHYDFKFNNQIDLTLLWMIHGNGLYKQTKFA